MGSTDKFCLRWNDFESNISTSFRDLRQSSDLFDVSLAVDSNDDDDHVIVQAHKVILAACSPLFRKMLSSKLNDNSHRHHPLIYLRGIKMQDLSHVLDFMYHGEVNVAQADLNSFLAVAEELKVKGLTERREKQQVSPLPGSSGSLKREAVPVKIEEEGLMDMHAGRPPPAKKRTMPPPQPKQRVHHHHPLSKPIAVEDDDDDIQDVTPSNPLPPPSVVSRGNGNSDFANEAQGEEEDYVEDEEFGQYDESGDISANYDDDGNLVEEEGEEPAPGTSDGSRGGEFFNSFETQQLARDIMAFMTTMASKSGGGYQCLVCSKHQRDLFNLRTHMIQHMVVENTSLVERLDAVIDENVYKQSSGCFSCLVCKMVVRKGKMAIRAHFIMKHLEVIQ